MTRISTGKTAFFSTICAVGLLSALPGSAHEAQSFVSGDRLLEWCEHDRDAVATYIMGFNDASEHAKQRIIETSRKTRQRSIDFEAFQFRALGTFCLPANLSATDYADIACKWFGAHRSKSAQPASALLRQAYKTSFPCVDE